MSGVHHHRRLRNQLKWLTGLLPKSGQRSSSPLTSLDVYTTGEANNNSNNNNIIIIGQRTRSGVWIPLSEITKPCALQRGQLHEGPVQGLGNQSPGQRQGASEVSMETACKHSWEVVVFPEVRLLKEGQFSKKWQLRCWPKEVLTRREHAQ